MRCVITPSAAKLVSPISLATLSRNKCYQDEDQWSSLEPRPLHIALAEWADLLVIAPLSASTLGRWTHGIADGLLSSLLLAFEKPVVAAPAMNTAMWLNDAVQNNWIAIQTNRKVIPLAPSSGLLACDRIGEGRMIDNELITLAIRNGIIQWRKSHQLKRDWDKKKLLVTAGPTIESLDAARYITNESSGYMGVSLAQAARFRGATVDLVHGPLQVPTSWLEGINNFSVKDSSELQKTLEDLQPSANAIAMTAAIADLRRKQSPSPDRKLSKESFLQSLSNDLEYVPDLLSQLVTQRCNGQIVLGFTALTGTDEEIKIVGKEKKINKGCDLMMVNPIDRPGQGFGDKPNGGFLIGPQGTTKPIPLTTKLDLAHFLLDEMLNCEFEITKKHNGDISPKF